MEIRIGAILVAMIVASHSADAAYRKGALLWKCDFTKDDAVKYGVADYRLGNAGLGIAYLPNDGKSGDGVLFFKTCGEKQSAKVAIVPDVKLSGVVQIEADVKGVDIGQGPQHFTGPKVMFPFVPRAGAKKVFPETPKEFGTYDWKTLVKVQTFPETAEDLCFVLGVEEAPGAFWVDSVRVYRAEEVSDEVGVPPVNEKAKCIPRGPYDKKPRHGGFRGVMSGYDMGEESIVNLAEVWGANLVRLQIGGQALRDARTIEDWFVELEKKLDWCIEVADRCWSHGIKVIVDLHSGPGCRVTKFLSNVLPADYDASDLCGAWRMIAARFKEHPATYAYDILNEPSVDPDTWRRVCQAVMSEVRKIDANTPFMMESVRHWYEGENVIYSPHLYSPHTLTHYGIGDSGVHNTRWSYPGYIDGVYWDKEQLRVALKPYIDFQKEHPGVRLCVGEFSCVAWVKGADKWIGDAIELFEEYGWDWCYHAYRAWPGWSVEYDHDANYTPGKFVKVDYDTDRKKILLRGLSMNRSMDGVLR